jgi:SAM-dependent methyltransferase
VFQEDVAKARRVVRQARHPIAYDSAMIERVLDMHTGSELLPRYATWIDAHLGGRVVEFRERLLPNILAFTDLRGMDVLDFGCGTGSTTVVLAEASPGARILGLDVDAPSLDIARMRLRHHGLEERVALQVIPPVAHRGDLPIEAGSFDFILANGVLEHVTPFAVRPQVVLEMWRLLRPGGMLYISETPNPLWPVDRHTTGLPFVPWMPRWMARRVAVAFGRHAPHADFDSRGWRGMTYWEVVRPLRRAGLPYEVLNLTRTGNRLLPAGAASRSAKRRAATVLLQNLAGRPLGALGVPTIALGPFLEHLCLQKPNEHGGP